MIGYIYKMSSLCCQGQKVFHAPLCHLKYSVSLLLDECVFIMSFQRLLCAKLYLFIKSWKESHFQSDLSSVGRLSSQLLHFFMVKCY